MLLASFAELPKLVALVSFLANVEDGFFDVGSLRLLLAAPFAIGLWLRLGVDVDDHPWTLVTVVCALKLLKHDWSCICAFVPVSKHETLLNEVKALARLRLMLLSNVFGSVTEAGFFQKVELRSLEEARVAKVFIGEKELHWLLDLGHSELV